MQTQISLSLKHFGRFDLVVVGGGCTGTVAAIKAARMGLKVAIVEKSNCFGGVATNGLVNIWHSLYDIYYKEQIIFGITDEIEQILLKTGSAVAENNRSVGIRFDPNALKVVLDELVQESKIKIFFHTFYNQLILENNKISGIVVGNKDGMGQIEADFFIDATGDGDLCRDAKLDSFVSCAVQPPSPTCFLTNSINGDLGELILKYGKEFGLDDDWGWDSKLPGIDNTYLRADFHIFSKMCNIADDLTEAEIEGRRKMYAFLQLIKKYSDKNHNIVNVCSHIGIRETVHYNTVFKATQGDLLLGKAYDDAVLKGTYRVDIHHQNDNGITFKYLDGTTQTFYGKSNKTVLGNWREEEGITDPIAPYYQIPFRILVQEKISNLIPIGRMLNADDGAFGALRVMVNLNQLGEAAAVGAYIALNEGKAINQIDYASVKLLL